MQTREIRDFRRSLRHFTRVTHTQLRQCCTEVTLAQCLVLLEVDDRERLTVGQLASRLRLDDSTLSRTIDGLVRRGLLDRVRDDRDRRVVWIGLTPEGKTASDAIHERNDAIYRNIFDKIPPSKREAVVRNFKILVQAFLDSEQDPSAGMTCTQTEQEAKP
jgi:DNA-binding MarR family transcriptional regulator